MSHASEEQSKRWIPVAGSVAHPWAWKKEFPVGSRRVVAMVWHNLDGAFYGRWDIDSHAKPVSFQGAFGFHTPPLGEEFRSRDEAIAAVEEDMLSFLKRFSAGIAAHNQGR